MMRVLIFGGTGSLGKKLIERLLPTNDVAVYSRDESKHWTIKTELADGELSAWASRLKFFVGDIRDASRVKEAIRQYRPTTIIIAAALKHVDTCEFAPSESIQTNVVGTQNVVNAVNDLQEAGSFIDSVLFVSTDKACEAANVYGMCKALSERIVTSQSYYKLFQKTKFVCTRYGNVLESRGSIIPLFKHQAENAQYITITDTLMTRFVMTLDESVDLIKRTLEHAKSGETWIPKLKSMRIIDLATIFSTLSGKEIRCIGIKPGEKLHEDLISESESMRVIQSSRTNDYIIRPATELNNLTSTNVFTYSSNDSVMSIQELKERLTQLNVLTF